MARFEANGAIRGSFDALQGGFFHREIGFDVAPLGDALRYLTSLPS